MEALSKISGPAAVMRRADVDTDIIIRIDRLTASDQTQLGNFAFEAIRFRPDGSEDPAFPFHQAGWRNAPILIAGENFGCGSSREGAVTALSQFGLRCIVAASFGDIFYSNCFQNGLLPVQLPAEHVEDLMRLSEAGRPSLTVDLERQLILAPNGLLLPFEIDSVRRQNLLSGLDDLGLTLRDVASITEWQRDDRERRPWVWASMAPL